MPFDVCKVGTVATFTPPPGDILPVRSEVIDRTARRVLVESVWTDGILTRAWRWLGRWRSDCAAAAGVKP